MKKLVLTLGLASLFMVACNNTPKQPEQAAEPVQEERPKWSKKSTNVPCTPSRPSMPTGKP